MGSQIQVVFKTVKASAIGWDYTRASIKLTESRPMIPATQSRVVVSRLDTEVGNVIETVDTYIREGHVCLEGAV